METEEVVEDGKADEATGDNATDDTEGPSRPSTPSMPIPIIDIIPKNEDEWWRPSHPPETYLWEEVRRQREKGGYPWTILDKDDEIDIDDYLDDDNLYEPVNPPPLLSAAGSGALIRRDHNDRGSLPKLDIPPEIEIITSEGLDGLDQPDRYDRGLDGDREWAHSDDENSQSQSQGTKYTFTAFTAGIRRSIKSSDSRPLTNKPPTAMEAEQAATTSKDVEKMEVEGGEEEEEAQEVPSGSTPEPTTPTPIRKKTTAFAILKGKAATAAGQMKQRFKIALPVRPKLNQWEGVKLARKKPKKKRGESVEPGDQQVPEGEEECEEEGGEGTTEKMEAAGDQEMADVAPPTPEPSSEEIAAAESKAEALKREKEAAAEEKKRKQKEQEEIKKQKAEEKKKEQEELRLKKEKEAEEKKKEQEELRLKKEKEAEERKREQDEIKRQKAEEKQRLKEEQEKKKAEEKAAKQKAAEEAKKAAEEAKKAKLEEQLAKAREAEELERQKQEELLRLREEAAEAAKLAPEEAGKGAATTEQPEIIEGEEAAGEIEPEQLQTPTGTGRRKKIKKTYVKLPELPKMPDLPHIDLDFKRKVIKRSKTPPGRPSQASKSKRLGVDETENQLAAQYADEIAARKLELENDNEEYPEKSGKIDPSIFVTQPSTEAQAAEEKPHVEWKPQLTSTKEPEEPKKPQITTQERLDKFGKSLKTFGIKSSKAMGQTMKVVGKDLQKFGVKTSETFQAHIEEVKAKQEAAKARTKELKAKEAEDVGEEVEMDVDTTQYPDYATEPRRKFRFRRRNESQEESEENPKQGQEEGDDHYENPVTPPTTSGSGGGQQGQTDAEGKNEDDDAKRTRSQLLGRAERDWESPLDLPRSRDVSEEPFSGESRESPPGSSLASSIAHVRKQGVLEEIDSDEFFLREKGISEGEDEEEINRFLVEELRQAFRTQENALAGFDLDESPQRPERLPRKPPRKEKSGDKSPSYQTFPPERTPRRKAPGYVSEYMGNQDQEMLDDDQYSNQEERGSGSFQEDFTEEFAEDGMRRVKEELEKIDHDIDDGQQEYEDDGRYEPVSSDEPVKPERRRKQPPTGAGGGPLYYNTVAGNEWMRNAEESMQKTPEAPRRDRSKRSKSNSISRDRSSGFDDEAKEASKIPVQTPPMVQAESEGRIDDADIDLDENFEYVDDAGYAIVHKGRATPPTTTPRRKKRGGGSKGSSLKRQTDSPQQQSDEQAFFSLPRGGGHHRGGTHIVPPSRPQRNYSTLKPRRPPRVKSNQNLAPKSPKSGEKSPDAARPSTAIGIMQGRPLPAPPRPERSPAPLNDLDQSSLERAVGARHYANNPSGRPQEVFEEPFTATNIPILGRLRYQPDTSGDANISVQTDQVLEDIEAAVVSSRRVQQQGDSLNTTATDGRDSRQGRPKTPSQPSSDPQAPYYPRRLHLDELDVSVLRVHDLTAHSIAVEHLQASQIEVNSLTATGSLSVASIHTQTLNSDQVNCNRLASDTVDLPSVPPPAFYNLSSPPVPESEKDGQENPEELRDYDKDESEILCPYTPFEDDSEIHYENLAGSPKPDSDFKEGAASPSEEFFLSSRNVEFRLTPDHSLEQDESCSANAENKPTESSGSQLNEKRTEEFPSVAEVTRSEAKQESSKLSERQQPVEISSDFRRPRSQSQTSDTSESSRKERVKQSPFHTEIRHRESTTATTTEPPSTPQQTSSSRGSRRSSEDIPQNLKNYLSQYGPPKSPPKKPEETTNEQSLAPSPPAGPQRVSSPTIPPPDNQPTTKLAQQTSQQPRSEMPTGQLAPATQRQVSPERSQDMIQVGLRLGRALARITVRGLQAMIEYIDVATTDDPSKAEQQRAHLQVLLCVILILIAGLLLSSQGEISPPRWEFLMPPPHL